METDAPKCRLVWKTAGIVLGVVGAFASIIFAFISMTSLAMIFGWIIMIVIEILIGKSTKHTGINQIQKKHPWSWYIFVINCIIPFLFSTERVGMHHLAVWHHKSIDKNQTKQTIFIHNSNIFRCYSIEVVLLWIYFFKWFWIFFFWT